MSVIRFKDKKEIAAYADRIAFLCSLTNQIAVLDEMVEEEFKKFWSDIRPIPREEAMYRKVTRAFRAAEVAGEYLAAARIKKL